MNEDIEVKNHFFSFLLKKSQKSFFSNFFMKSEKNDDSEKRKS